ncbi:MAG: transcription elongation factor GreB [Alteromonadaceae bacterium]|nr:transcription elongation factor GreB [Alteromonadaceae bacterium]
MIPKYSITGIKDIITESGVSDEFLSADLILTSHGLKRNAINYLKIGDKVKKKLFDVSENDLDLNTIVGELEITDSLKVAIDISLLDRRRIADVFVELTKLSTKYRCKISIVYLLAKYSPPSGLPVSNHSVKPVSSFFSGWANQPGLPIMTVVGLGYERDKAIGAIEYLESSRSFLFFPKSSEEQYFDDVLATNSEIVSSTDENHKINYRVESPVEALLSLDSLLEANKNKYKIVLLPFGPKIFYAMNLLASIVHSEVSVWHVSGEEEDGDSSQDREVASVFGFKFEMLVTN